MARLLIIITSKSYDLWDKTRSWNENSVNDERAFRSYQINEDCVVIFSHPSGAISEQKKITTKWIKTLVDDESLVNYSEFYVASHKNRVVWTDVRQVLKNRFKGGIDFIHADTRDVHLHYDLILGLLNSPSLSTLNAIIKAIEIPVKLEVYLEAILNLTMDNQSGAEATMEKLESEIKDVATDSEWREWQTLKKRIHDWDVSQSEKNIVNFNDQFFQFAEKELIDRYPYFSEME